MRCVGHSVAKSAILEEVAKEGMMLFVTFDERLSTPKIA